MNSKPWIFRTYAGHSSALASNKLFKDNLSKGQTGLSVAFDLPTQTGYDSDHQLARGEVGKVGVPINHLGDMRTLFKDIPLDKMNTSMTINATAPWLLALYVALAEEQDLKVNALQGTVQNDIIKEYLSRGTYIFPPEDSLNLIADVTEYCYRNIPKWNPINICSYHLQEVGATIEEEVALSISTATAVLDKIRLRVSAKEFPFVVGRVSFFVNAGIKFISEICKMRAFVELWNEICLTKYGVKEEKLRRFRYGVQVNSLGLTEQQPENNVYRILLELLAVTLSKNARARAIQLPAWNEAMGLPRPWDQQWSLRMQQVLAYETDLLEYEDIFDQNPIIEKKVKRILGDVNLKVEKIDKMGGTVAALDYMKRALVSSNAKRLSKIESGETIVVGVNKFTTSEESGLSSGDGDSVQVVDKKIEKIQISSLTDWRSKRNNNLVEKAKDNLKDAARKKINIMTASIEAAKAGVTTGEWADTMREVFGEFRAPTGVTVSKSSDSESLPTLQKKVKEVAKKVFIPFTVGGGIKSPNDIGSILEAGADKVSINSSAIYNPNLLNDSAKIFGSQCIVLAMDVKKNSNSWYVHTHAGTNNTKIDALDWAKRAVKLGAGELLITSMDRDGTKKGFDLDLTKVIVAKLSSKTCSNRSSSETFVFTLSIPFFTSYSFKVINLGERSISARNFPNSSYVHSTVITYGDL